MDIFFKWKLGNILILDVRFGKFCLFLLINVFVIFLFMFNVDVKVVYNWYFYFCYYVFKGVNGGVENNFVGFRLIFDEFKNFC